MSRSRVATAGIILAAVGGALVATVFTLATVSFFTPFDLPSGSERVQQAGEDVALSVPPSNASDALAVLNDAISQAERERSQLSSSLLALNRDVVALQEALDDALLERGEQPEGAEPKSAPADTAVDGVAQASTADGEDGGEDGQTNAPAAVPTAFRQTPAAERLVAAGVDPDTAAFLQRRQDAWQLERLELIDRAAREGWGDSEQLDQALDEYDETRPDLRADLGDEAWDRFLQESGRSNRVSIASIIPGSAADTAGLRVGDIVMAYDGVRVFVPGDLQSQTRAGTRGETVGVQVERNGSTQSLSVLRGPLGVTLARRRSDT